MMCSGRTHKHEGVKKTLSSMLTKINTMDKGAPDALPGHIDASLLESGGHSKTGQSKASKTKHKDARERKMLKKIKKKEEKLQKIDEQLKILDERIANAEKKIKDQQREKRRSGSRESGRKRSRSRSKDRGHSGHSGRNRSRSRSRDRSRRDRSRSRSPRRRDRR